MPTEVKAPVFPESIAEGTLTTWYKKPGESVSPDEKLADIETDKVVLEVASTSAGTLGSVVKSEGETVVSGEVIGYLVDGAAAARPSTTRAEHAPKTRRATPATDSRPPPAEAVPEAPAPAPKAAAVPPTEPAQGIPSGISPAARKLLQEHSLSASDLKGTGRQGRITKTDVLDLLTRSLEGTEPNTVVELTAALQESPPPRPAEPALPAEAAPPPIKPPSPPAPAAAAPARAASSDHRDERVPMSRIRQRIAERLVQAQHTAAILTTFNEVNMKPVMDLRAKYKESFEKRHGVKLGFMSFFLKASIEALRKFPEVNASVEGADIVYHHYYDVGIAVSGPRGLLVPIVRDADRLAFHEIESAIRDFGARSMTNQIGMDDLRGGTFTISNGGVFGSLLSTPILNPPQSAILGMHTITDRAVVENREVVIRPIMYLALSYDHRIIDGRAAVQFLVVVKELLEDPSRLLLQV